MRRSLLSWIALSLLVACGDADVELQDSGPERAAVTAAVFGSEVSPDTVVAEVNGATILASEVAAALLFYPTLTTEQVVEDLIDARIAASHAAPEASRFLEVARIDGERRGLMTAWMWAHVWSESVTYEPTDEEVAAFLAEPTNAPLFGQPALVRTSQLLVQLGDEDARPGAEALARRLRTALDLMPGPYSVALLRDLIETETPSLPDNLRLALLEHITFPRRFSGPAEWDHGTPAVPEPVAAAAFENASGSMLGPVQSPQGYHLILVEDHIPATFEPNAETEAIARDTIIARHGGERFQAESADAFAQIPYQINPDATRTLAASGLERVSESRDARAEQY